MYTVTLIKCILGMVYFDCLHVFNFNRIIFESRTVLESELEDDLCTEDCSSMDDSSFLPSFNKKPSPFATSKTMFEINETGKVFCCSNLLKF